MHLRFLTTPIAHLARIFLCGVLLLSTLAGAAGAVTDLDSLAEMRARRRAAVKKVSLAADKSGEPGLFGLLVIPVDFADARLPDSWNPDELTSRLTAGSGESLRRYFSVASRGRLDLRVTQAPVIHLPGTRRDYSDVGLNGFTRTRALASQSLEAVRALGMEFRRLDMEGPDRTPGTDDDDGEIDGVLILHAGIGQENDASEGLVQALQFFLDEPVISQGVSATFYAVASLNSGPGIWAHETAHLLGLEDRYDPYLRPAGGSEVMSRGGLGRFSLMASGAWGTGAGYGAALPDAYSCLQLGWYVEDNLALKNGTTDTLLAGLASGVTGRLWSRGLRESEFFLLEARDPAAAHPFDADIPGSDLLIYHVDETLPEGRLSDDGDGTWHLRVSLVEADDDFALRRGDDPGREEDLFPGPLGKDEFSPTSIPSSWGYGGDSGVALFDIRSVPGGVSFVPSGWDQPALDFVAGFQGETDMVLDIAAWSGGAPLVGLTCLVAIVSDPSFGSFEGGQLSVQVAMADDGTGTWRPEQPVSWYPDPGVPGDAFTRLSYSFVYEGGASLRFRTWYWKDNGGVLDFANVWPGQWTISAPENVDTYWHRWDTAPWVTADQSPVLACTGAEYFDSSQWPAVNYQNRGFVTLTSGEMGPDVKAVRLIHGMEVEYLTASLAMDGGLAFWVDPAGREIPAEPLEGWRGEISAQAFNTLHGQNGLIQEELELDAGIPLWRTDILPVPEGVPGPWRLRLAFGSNSLWRYRGWFVAGIDPVTADPLGAAFAGRWNPDGQPGLFWSWPWSQGEQLRFVVQHRDQPDSPWTNLADEIFEPAQGGSNRYSLSEKRVLEYLGSPVRARHELRVVGYQDKGRVATREIVVFPDGGDGQFVSLSRPWPNPSTGTVKFLVEIPAGVRGELGIFDLRGRRVLDRSLGSGSHLLEWDGSGSRGGRVASGTYIIRLEGSGPAKMRKVVLLH